jgi:hypothetical protein
MLWRSVGSQTDNCISEKHFVELSALQQFHFTPENRDRLLTFRRNILSAYEPTQRRESAFFIFTLSWRLKSRPSQQIFLIRYVCVSWNQCRLSPAYETLITLNAYWIVLPSIYSDHITQFCTEAASGSTAKAHYDVVLDRLLSLFCNVAILHQHILIAADTDTECRFVVTSVSTSYSESA